MDSLEFYKISIKKSNGVQWPPGYMKFWLAGPLHCMIQELLPSKMSRIFAKDSLCYFTKARVYPVCVASLIDIFCQSV